VSAGTDDLLDDLVEGGAFVHHVDGPADQVFESLRHPNQDRPYPVGALDREAVGREEKFRLLGNHRSQRGGPFQG